VARFEVQLAKKRGVVESLIAANQEDRGRVEDAFLDFLDSQLLQTPSETPRGGGEEEAAEEGEEGEEGEVEGSEGEISMGGQSPPTEESEPYVFSDEDEGESDSEAEDEVSRGVRLHNEQTKADAGRA